jgi:hypothetical protein
MSSRSLETKFNMKLYIEKFKKSWG